FEQLGETYTAPDEWDETVVDLSAYAGQEVYLAIQCVSEDAFILLIDDIMVSKPVPNESVTDLSMYVKSYPNPVTDVWTVTAYGLEIDRVEICDMAGSVVFRSASRLATETWRVNMAGFTTGLYMARIYTNAGVQTLKVVVR
ncbi:MAG: T9SS type A sorting domain-containing protein, partial [Bacteroidales bacterium]|nr:T9SS type A sorting domain-containing protein [Bacteroidales bacterium]